MNNFTFELCFLAPNIKNLKNLNEEAFLFLKDRFILGNLGTVYLKTVTVIEKGDYIETKLSGELHTSEELNNDGIVYCSLAIIEEHKNEVVARFRENIGKFVKGYSIKDGRSKLVA